MKIKVANLKANLSKVLKEIERSGDTVEVCVREAPVAYLTPAKPVKGKPGSRAEIEQLVHAFAGLGMKLHPPASVREEKYTITPRIAGDGRCDISTIEVMRSEKPW